MPVVDPSSVETIVHGAEMAGAGLLGRGGLKRLVGPSVDEIATAMARWTSFRVGNVQRIGEAADKKAKDRDGGVHPRVVHRLLEEGSYCDDELMVDYLGGVLAGSRTPGGRDDRAVAWSDLITGMSAQQVRAHYLIYRELAVLIHDRNDITLSMDAGRRQATLAVPFGAFIMALAGQEPLYEHQIASLTSHAIPGLARAGLIGDAFAFGSVSEDLCSPIGVPFEAISDMRQVVVVQPSFAGMELFGWAQGLPDLAPSTFARDAEPFDVEPPLALLGGRLPLLPELPQSESPETDGGSEPAAPLD